MIQNEEIELQKDIEELGKDYIKQAQANALEIDQINVEMAEKVRKARKDFKLKQDYNLKKQRLIKEANFARNKYNEIYTTLTKLVLNNNDLINAKNELQKIQNEYDNFELSWQLHGIIVDEHKE